LWQIFPAHATPHQNPTSSFEEFYVGNYPPGINPEIELDLDLAHLAELTEIVITGDGRGPA